MRETYACFPTNFILGWGCYPLVHARIKKSNTNSTCFIASKDDNFRKKISPFNKISRNNCGDITPHRWYEYFRGLFNDTNFGNDEFSENVSDFLIQHDSECDICTNDAVSIDGEILNRNISIAEITDVINHLQNGKFSWC